MTAEITLALVFAALQVLTLRVSQYALPHYYFTTGQLFERRSEVTAGAILFRLGIPFVAGLLVATVTEDDRYEIAATSGAVAWFLILWSIAWSPSNTLPFENRTPIVALLLAFWIAFTALPIAGVATFEFVDAVAQDGGGWGDQFALAVVTSIPISLVVGGIASLSQRRVTFVDDEPDADAGADENEYYDEDRDLKPMLGFTMGVAATLVVVAMFLVGRRSARR